MNDTLRVLIIDDSPEDREVMRQLLLTGSERQYLFMEATTGVEAIKLLSENKADSFDCILLDYHLPDVDATELLSALGCLNSLCCPVVVVTGLTTTQHGSALLQTGAQDFIGKSWLNPESLTRSVENAIERFRMLQALKESEERLRLSLEAAQMGIYDWDMITNRVTWTPKHEALWGYQPGEFGGSHAEFTNRVHPEDLPLLKQETARCLLSRDRYQGEFRVVWPDGSQHWIKALGEFTYDAGGQAVRMRGVVEDVSDRKQLEASLHETEIQRAASRYTLCLLETSLDPLVTISPEGKITDVNAAMEAMTGLPRSELIGTDFADYFEDPMAAQLGYRQAFQEGSVRDYALEIRYRDGHLTTVMLNAAEFRDESGKVVGVFAAARDMSEINRAHEIIRELYKRLYYISTRVPGVIFQFKLRPDGSSCFPYSSEAIRDIYRVTPEEVKEDASAVFAILHPEDYDGIVASIQQSADTLRPWQYEYRVRFADGTVRWLLGNSVPNKVADGSVLWHGFITDITERKGLETQLATTAREFSTIFHSSPIGIAISRLPDGKFIDVNDAFLEIYGFERSAIIGHSSIELGFWADLSYREKIISTVLQHGLVKNLELEYQRQSDQTTRTLLASMDTIDINAEHCVVGMVIDITERKAIESAWKESEQQYRNESRRLNEVIWGTHIGTWEWNILTGEVSFNERWAEIAGYTLSELEPVGIHTWMKLAHPDDLPHSTQLLERCFTRESDFYECEIRMHHKNGDWVWVLDRGRVVEWSDDGKPLRMSGTHSDITQKKQAELNLRASEERLSIITSSVFDAIIMINEMGDITFWNQAAERIFGYSFNEVVGRCLHSIVSPLRFRDAFRQALPHFQQTGQGAAIGRTVELVGLRRDGSEFPLELSLSAVLIDGLWNSIGVVRDITERKLAEDRIRESESRFRKMANAAPVLIWVAGTDKRCHWFNQVWLDFTGRTMEQEQGVGWTKGVHPDDLNRCLEIYTTHFDWREPFQMEYRLRRHDGEYRWLSDHGVPLIDEQGNFSGYIGSCMDVTHSKELTLQLRKALKDLGTQTTRLQTLLETASDGIHILDMQGNIIQFSDSFADMLGYTHEELAKLNVADWEAKIPKDQQIGLIKGSFNQATQFETQHRRKDGSVIEVEINAKGIELAGDYYLYASARNISERKNLEKQLIASKAEIEDLYDHAPCGYHSLGPDGIYQRINATELEWLGCSSKEEVIGMLKPSDFFTTAGKRLFKKTLARIKQTGHAENVGYDLVGKNGSIRHVSFTGSVIKDADGQFLRTRSVLYDITELKKVKDKLEQLSYEQRLMLDNELIGIAKVRNRRIIWKNKALDRIFGYVPKELQGQLTKTLYPDDTAYQALGEAAYPILEAHGVYRTQLKMKRKDEESIWIDISGVQLLGGNNETLWFLGEITEIKEYQQQIEKIAFHDALTGLPNRLLVSDRLNQALHQAERSGHWLAVCYLDLDGFKPINDTYGHPVGDKLLIEIAHRLQTCIRSNDTAGRLGGDEFVLLLTDLENVEQYLAVLERVIEAIKLPINLDESIQVSVTTSIGVTLFPQDAPDPDTLLRYADQALYSAKQNGRNCYQFFDIGLENRMATHRETVGRISQGLASGEFRLYFQPKVNFTTGLVVGMEALIRWQHPTEGLLEPKEFLPIVENDEIGLMMGNWVLREALRQMQAWADEGMKLQVSINVFARQMHQPNFMANLEHILSEHTNVPAKQLQLEITETAGLPELSLVQQIITECEQLGIGFAIDDFGTGYSSLVYLRHLSVAELKIDQSFVRGLLTNHEDQAIVEGIIGLGHAFKRSVVAEGVETAAQIHRLLALGCEIMQGYYIARPMPAGQVAAWVGNFHAERYLE
jgi:diguanylate cyclase (GGDEF)-like protein/PAS domain S-box-containing protein